MDERAEVRAGLSVDDPTVIFIRCRVPQRGMRTHIGLPVADGPKTTLRPTVPIQALFGTYSKSARISPQKPPSPSRYPSRNQGSETRQKP